MGAIRNFKWVRPVPPLDYASDPGFTLYSFPAMRRLSVVQGQTILGGVPSTVLSIFVPGNWWADGHEVWWRQLLLLDDAGNPIMAPVTIHEQCQPSQGAPAFNLITGAIWQQPGKWYMVITRRFFRDGSNIIFWDDDQVTSVQPGPPPPFVSTFGIGGLTGGFPGIVLTPPGPGWDFTSPLQFDWAPFTMGGFWPGIVSVRACTALIAPPLNLRS